MQNGTKWNIINRDGEWEMRFPDVSEEEEESSDKVRDYNIRMWPRSAVNTP